MIKHEKYTWADKCICQYHSTYLIFIILPLHNKRHAYTKGTQNFNSLLNDNAILKKIQCNTIHFFYIFVCKESNGHKVYIQNQDQ